jgi:hypothetical protein
LPEALHGLVEELREQRLASERRFDASDRRFGELRADTNARFAESDRRFEKLRADRNARFEELRADMKAGFAEVTKQLALQNARFEQAFRRIDAMGTRWGLQTEAAFREGLRFIIDDRFGAEVERWEHEDREGVVFGHRARVELDVVVRDGETVVVELKAHVGRADVAEFARTADLYDALHGVRSRRVLISASVDARARGLAGKLGIEISTDLG